MKITTHDSIAEVSEADWNRLVGRDRLVARHAFLRAVERAQINDCSHFYCLVKDDRGTIAQAAAYSISTEVDSFASGWIKQGIRAVRSVWPGFMIMRSVECGNPVALGTTLCVRPGVEEKEVVPALVDAIEQRAERMGVSVLLFRDFCEGEGVDVSTLSAMGYRRVQNLPRAELPVEWTCFEDYLDSMRSRYRNKIRAQMRLFDRPEVSTEIVTDFSELAPELTRLWASAYEHATEYRREVLTERFFRSVSEGLGERSAVLLFRVHGKPAAFSLLLFDDDTLIPCFCGLDYGLNSTYSLYFNLLYGAVTVAIEHKMAKVDFGITTLFPKIHLGCRIVPLSMYMKHRQPLFNRAVSTLFRLSTPQLDLTEPKVFKSG